MKKGFSSEYLGEPIISLVHSFKYLFDIFFNLIEISLNFLLFTVRPKLRKVEKRLVPVLEMLSVDELMETNTYQRFNKLIESVFETIDDDVIVTDEMGKHHT